MKLKDFLDTPPWEWPPDAGKQFREVLTNRRASESDRVAAAGLAGDFTVINDELAGVLIGIVERPDEPEKLRAKSATALGAVLEYCYTDGFDEPDDVAITERTFLDLQTSLQKLYFDEGLPKELRRRILESSVRAPEEWHKEAIRKAYASGDQTWKVTAVFSMGYVRGFDKQILEALQNPDVEIHSEAVSAAGTWELDEAWSHVIGLIENRGTPKPLLVAAIHAAACIRPVESTDLLMPLTNSSDGEIAEAAEEALVEAGYTAHDFDEDDFDEDQPERNGTEWIN